MSDFAKIAKKAEETINGLFADNRRLEAENDRLREALQRCREEFEQWHDAKHVMAIIDAALAKEEGK